MIGTRITMLRKKLKINQTQLAGYLNVKPAAISQMESGRIRPSLDKVIEMARLWDVNLHWLLTGGGPMFVEVQVSDLKGTKHYYKGIVVVVQ